MSDFHVHQMTDNKLKPMWCEKCGEITKHSCSCKICTPHPDAVEAMAEALREAQLRHLSLAKSFRESDQMIMETMSEMVAGEIGKALAAHEAEKVRK